MTDINVITFTVNELQNVIAGRGFNHFRNIARIFKGKGSPFEFRIHLTTTEHAQLAAIFGASRIFAVQAGQCFETFAFYNTCSQIGNFLIDVLFVGS
ncbi:hypothetical protein DSECCO2_594460 [anaerobic digester metagenome]